MLGMNFLMIRFRILTTHSSPLALLSFPMAPLPLLRPTTLAALLGLPLVSFPALPLLLLSTTRMRPTSSLRAILRPMALHI